MHLNFRTVFIFLFLSSFPVYAQSGELFELAEINFTGNKNISSDELKSVIYSEETPWWFYKFLNSFTSLGKEPVYFDSSSIKIDIEAMKAYYNSNGFFKVLFEYSYVVDTTDKEITLTYKIIENEPARYGKIEFKGLTQLPDNIESRIYWESRIDTSLSYKQMDVEKSIAHSIEILVNRGYMFVNHDSTLIYIDSTSNIADVTIFYNTGNRFKIGEITVIRKGKGASHVSDELLTELTDIEKDEYYNQEKLRASQRRLVRTGLFNSFILEPMRKDTADGYVPLRLEGNIGNMNEFLPGILMNDESNAFNLGVNAIYSRKNFLGDARKLTFSNEIAVEDIVGFSFNEFFSTYNYTINGYARVSLKLEQPYLFQKPIYGSLENYFQTQTELGLNRKIYGVKAALEFELPYFTFINQLKPYYNLEFLNYRFNDIPIPEFSLNSATLDIFNSTSYLGLQLGSAKANNLYYPTGGSNQLINIETAISNVTLELSGPEVQTLIDSGYIKSLSELHESQSSLFYRLEYTSTYYFPISNDYSTILGLKGKIGHIQTFKGGSELIPLNKTFYSGGSNSIRGWRSKALYPQDQNEFIDFSTASDSLRGGNFLLEGSLEYRNRFVESIGIVLFTDYGNTWNGYKDFRFDEIALAAGFGLRYYTSIAPFRIDFGLKLYDPFKKKFIWNNWDKAFFHNLEFHFGIGEAF